MKAVYPDDCESDYVYIPIPETYTHEDRNSRDQYIDEIGMSHAQLGILLNTISQYATHDPIKELFPYKRYVSRNSYNILEERKEWLDEMAEKWAKQDASIERYNSHGIDWIFEAYPKGGGYIKPDYTQLREHNNKRLKDFCENNCPNKDILSDIETGIRKLPCTNRSERYNTCPIYDELVEYING